MPQLWTLSLPTTETALDALENELWEQGVLAITLDQAPGELPYEAFYETPAGATPIWKNLTLTALIDPESLPRFRSLYTEKTHPGIQFKQAPKEDFVQTQAEQTPERHIAGLSFITEQQAKGAPLPDNTLVLSTYGAFGTGEHATTRMCLEAMCAHRDKFQNQTVLDVGIGSGILSLAALKWGASDAIGIEIDPVAREACARNAENSGLQSRLSLYDALPNLPSSLPAPALIVANIYAKVLLELKAQLEAYRNTCPHPPWLLLTGILEPQANDLLQAYQGLHIQASEAGWVLLSS